MIIILQKDILFPHFEQPPPLDDTPNSAFQTHKQLLQVVNHYTTTQSPIHHQLFP